MLSVDALLAFLVAILFILGYACIPIRLNSLPKRVPAVTRGIVASGANLVFVAKFETAFAKER